MPDSAPCPKLGAYPPASLRQPPLLFPQASVAPGDQVDQQPLEGRRHWQSQLGPGITARHRRSQEALQGGQTRRLNWRSWPRMHLQCHLALIWHSVSPSQAGSVSSWCNRPELGCSRAELWDSKGVSRDRKELQTGLRAGLRGGRALQAARGAWSVSWRDGSHYVSEARRVESRLDMAAGLQAAGAGLGETRTQPGQVKVTWRCCENQGLRGLGYVEAFGVGPVQALLTLRAGGEGTGTRGGRGARIWLIKGRQSQSSAGLQVTL